jgi:hypothetical protein
LDMLSATDGIVEHHMGTGSFVCRPSGRIWLYGLIALFFIF